MVTVKKLVAALALASIATMPALAAYPDKPVTIVVPFSAGGSVDQVAREVSRHLKDRLGQTFVVDNKPGASANIGANFVAKSNPDGYTLLMNSATTPAVAPYLFKNLPYNPITDLVPLALVAGQPNVLVVHPSVPAKTFKEFVELAKSKPGGMNYAVAAVGGPQHMSGELFMSMTGTKLERIAYKGGANAVTDLLGGQVEAMFGAMPEVLQFIKADKLRPLAVTSRERTALLPDVPSVHESGLKDFELIGWIGMSAPANVPKEILETLNKAVNDTLADPSFQNWLLSVGLEARGGSLEQFSAFVNDERQKYRRLIEEGGIQPM